MTEVKRKTSDGIKMVKSILESIETRDCNKSAKIIIDSAISCCNELSKLNKNEHDKKIREKDPCIR